VTIGIHAAAAAIHAAAPAPHTSARRPRIIHNSASGISAYNQRMPAASAAPLSRMTIAPSSGSSSG
jgi:hypothetical protein